MYNTEALSSPLHALIAQTQKSKDLYKPLILRLSNQADQLKFEQIITQTNGLQVFDTIREQVAELLKCIKPTAASIPKDEFQNAVSEKLGNSNEYGVWVYYPWSNKLVHLLDEAEFVVVRTNRNKHKITEKEQQMLSTKKIGVVGLSVGQSVSLTLAMERGFGELRIADFDELDLSNINRIRTGVQNIAHKKTVIVAREIAEIDPFLSVVCYDKGVTEENIEDFLTGNGKLDLLIDECDSFDIKINARKIAKQLQIPVLMEGSDRGTIDIERFDLEPQRPILHGMVDHLDMDKFKDLKSFDEKIPYITAVTGFETLSMRMKASAMELMTSISTWPQLASAVTFGGGISADLSRRILLNSLKVSGRFFLDLDELISDAPVEEAARKHELKKSPLTTEEITTFISENKLHETVLAGKDLSENELKLLVDAVKLAPSGGNNQPWRLHYQNKRLHFFLDESTALAYLDPQFISSYTSIGAAIENLLLKAATLNLQADWKLTAEFAPKHLAVFSFSDSNTKATNEEILLEKQIPLRHTNRQSPALRTALSDEQIAYFTELVSKTDGAKLTFVQDTDKIKRLAEIATAADLLRIFIPEAHEDFITREMRWTVEQTNQTQDGIGIHTLDLSNNDMLGIRLLSNRKMIDFLAEIKGGGAFGRLLSQQFNSSSAIGLITMPDHEVNSWIKAGIAAEKLWLGATAKGFQIHPVNVPLLFFYKSTVENDVTISLERKQQLAILEKELNLIFDKPENQTSTFMFRIFEASPSPERTIRKSNNKIFSIGRA